MGIEDHSAMSFPATDPAIGRQTRRGMELRRVYDIHTTGTSLTRLLLKTVREPTSNRLNTHILDSLTCLISRHHMNIVDFRRALIIVTSILYDWSA